MRLGVYGGTFDPIHDGHLAVARAARDAHRLDRLLLVPSARPPHKSGADASDQDRLEMVRLACEGEIGLEASSIEVERRGVSYTIETLEELRRRFPESEFFFVMGGDSAAEFPTWRRAPDILRTARIVVVHRPGFVSRIDAGRFPAELRGLVEQTWRDEAVMEPSPASSSEIRKALRERRSDVPYLDPRVVSYIESRRLYSPE
jgi:nicotinate-nucleotide adenylyltransferase